MPDMRGVMIAVLGVALAASGARAQMVEPLDPPPAAEALQPGLAVCYLYGLVRTIDQMVAQEDGDCAPGEPLAQLDSFVGAGKVLTSDKSDGVMARITGLIHLAEPGMYSFAFESNDGVRLEIADYMVVQDPDVHSDQYSELGQIYAEVPGWFPLTIRYFERKSTSTLRFFWGPPGHEGTMPLVPAEVLAHQP